MNAISPVPINSDFYFREMHELDKDPEPEAWYKAEGVYDGDTITSLRKERLLNGDNSTSPNNWKSGFPSTFPYVSEAKARISIPFFFLCD